jgi:hypothetical protein
LTSHASLRSWLTLAALLCAPGAGVAVPPPPAPPASTAAAAAEGPDADFAKRMPELMSVVEEYRGLRFEHPVPLHTISAAELGEKLAAGVEVGPRSALGDVRTLEIGLKAFGLIPPSLDLQDAIVKHTPDELAGYYDPRDKTLTLVTGPKSLFGEALVKRDGAALAGHIREGLALHELTHALEDQHFDLSRFIGGDALSDAAMARWALVEGDATLVMLADFTGARPDDIPMLSVILRQMIAEPQRFLALTPGAPGAPSLPLAAPGAAGSPRWFGDTTVFGYLQGASFCAKVLERGGRRLLDQAFRADPPRSTEQILHPEKWFGHRDDPVVIAWPDLRGELPGRVKAAEGQLGELGIEILLRQGSGGPRRSAATDANTPNAVSTSNAAHVATAAGWGGDRFAVYRRTAPERGGRGRHDASAGADAAQDGGEATILAWITDWDTEQDATRFAVAMGALGADWRVERTAARRVVVLRGPLSAAERTRLIAKLAKAPAEPAANRAVDAAAIDPQRKIGAPGSVIAARLAERTRQAMPSGPLSTGHLSEDRRTYSYPEVGVSVRLPSAFAGWQAQKPQNPTVLQYLTGPQGGSLTVSASDMHQDKLALEVIEPFVERGMQSAVQSFAKLDGRIVETGSQRAYELRCRFTRGGVELERLQRLYKRGTRAITVGVEARADRWSEIEPSARELLAGVTLEPAAGSTTAATAPTAPPATLSAARAGGAQLLLQVRIDRALRAEARADVLRREVEALRLRLAEALGDAASPTSQVEEVAGERIAVRLPPLERPERLRQLVLAGGLVELRLTAYPDQGSSGVERAEILGHYGGRLPRDVEILESQVARRPPGGTEPLFFAVETRCAVTSRDLSGVRVDPGMSGQPVVTLTLQPEAARTFGDFTSAGVGRALAIVVDGKVMLAPIINSRITDSAMIEGGFSPDEAGDLATALRHPLPAAVQCLEERDLLGGAQVGAPHPCR